MSNADYCFGGVVGVGQFVDQQFAERLDGGTIGTVCRSGKVKVSRASDCVIGYAIPHSDGTSRSFAGIIPGTQFPTLVIVQLFKERKTK